MKPSTSAALAAALLMTGAAAPRIAAKERDQIAEQHKWNLADIYPSDEAWRQAKGKLESEVPALAALKGTLGQSAARLLAALELDNRLSKEFSRLYSYASMASDTDTRDSKKMAMEQELRQLGASIQAQLAFLDPEILALGKERIDAFLAAEKGLAVYRQKLDNILRKKAHTLSEAEERIVAHASLMSGGPESIYTVLANADFPWPEVTLSTGTVKLDQSAYSLHRAAPDRGDRKKVFAAFFGRLHDYRRTMGATYSAAVKGDMFYQRSRNYASCLEAALFEDNLPVAVYRTLVDAVNANLPTFHRYLKLRQRMLGVPELHYHDLYAPLVPAVDLDYSIDEGRKLVLAAFAPLGKDYVAVTDRSFRERWIDVYPTEGKRSGAYMNGSAYDVHPYLLLNYNGKYEDVSTLAHELGHTLHSHYSNTSQEFVNSQYATFVAEVASTFNEALLLDHMLKTVTDPKLRLSLLGNELEGIKGSVFRQTQFAEFEMTVHELAEQGEALTGDRFEEIYRDITRRYYGHDKGVCIVDPEIDAEWSYIPHFYSSFYVFQYATSHTAAAALVEPVLEGDAAALARYLEFLKSGSSDYPIALLRKAGVDMTTRAPFEANFKRMNQVIDEMEKLLTAMGK